MPHPSIFQRLRHAGTALGTLAGLAISCLAPVPGTAATAIAPVPAYAELPLPDNQSITTLPTGELGWLGQRPIEPAPKGLPTGLLALTQTGCQDGKERWRRTVTRPGYGGGRPVPIGLPSSEFIAMFCPTYPGKPAPTF